MARFTEYYGKPIFRVRFTRTDRKGSDLLCVAAWSKEDAAAATRRMYGARLKSIGRITRETTASLAA